MNDDLRYPVGRFEKPERLSDAERRDRIDQVDQTPAALRRALAGLGEEQLDTPYRPGGWTVRQVTHHISDSHLNAYVRMKLAVTEDRPTVKTYDEARWAELPDGRGAPVELSLVLLEALHRRWVLFMRSLKPADFSNAVNHPESGMMSLDTLLAMYAWHGRHHVAHVTSLRGRMGW